MYENGQGVSQGDRIESRVAENVFVACMKPIESEDIREQGYLMGTYGQEALHGQRYLLLAFA
jgi:hypothetical protein